MTQVFMVIEISKCMSYGSRISMRSKKSRNFGRWQKKMQVRVTRGWCNSRVCKQLEERYRHWQQERKTQKEGFTGQYTTVVVLFIS